MASRTITRLTVAANTPTVLTFAEGALDVATFEIDGHAFASSDGSIVLLTDSNYTSKTVGGFTLTVDVSVSFWAEIVSTGTATDDPDLQANAIVTLSQVKAYLNIPSADTTHDAFLKTLINQSSDILEDFVNGKIVLQDITDVVSGNGDYIMTANYKPVARVGIDSPMSSPLASDSFTSTFATTNGLGHTQSQYVGTGGSGLTWVVGVGGFEIATSKARSTFATSAAYVDVSESDVIAEVAVTWTTEGTGGLVVRYVDANNYIRVYRDDTTVYVVNRVAGVNTTLASVVTTYVADAKVKCVCDGVKLRIYYNDVQVGSELYCHNHSTSTRFGIYATESSVTLDNFVVYSLLDAIQYRLTPTSAWTRLVTVGKENMICNQKPKDSTYIELYSNVFPEGQNNVLQFYQAGYVTVPLVFVKCATEMCALAFKESRNGENMLAVGSRSFSISGSSENGGLVRLTEDHKRTLQPYIFFDSPIADLTR